MSHQLSAVAVLPLCVVVRRPACVAGACVVAGPARANSVGELNFVKLEPASASIRLEETGSYKTGKGRAYWAVYEGNVVARICAPSWVPYVGGLCERSAPLRAEFTVKVEPGKTRPTVITHSIGRFHDWVVLVLYGTP